MFDLEDMEKVLLVASDCKCKLKKSYIEEAVDEASLIEDIESTWDAIKSVLDGNDVRLWTYCYLSEEYDIKVQMKDGTIKKYYCDGKTISDELDESLDDSMDPAYTYHQMETELRNGKVFEKESGSFDVKFPEEKEHCKKILKSKGYNYEISGKGDWYHFEYWKDSEKRIQEAFGTQKFDIEFVDKEEGYVIRKAVIRGKDQDDAIKRFFKKPYNVACEITKIVPHGQKETSVAASKSEVKEPLNV